MQKTDNEDKSYILIADVGKDLVLKDENSVVINRTKEVYVSALGTLNVWEEIVELPPEPEVVIDTKQQEIAELEAKLAQLKAEVQAQ